jgi:hypothetical protein
MTDKSDSSEITDLSSTKLLKSVNNENKLPTISPYILEHKHKDWNDSAAKLQTNLASTGFHPHQPQVSPTATSSSALPGYESIIFYTKPKKTREKSLGFVPHS